MENDDQQQLLQLGWTSHFESQWLQYGNDSWTPARVVGVRRNQFRVSDGIKEWNATIAGKLSHKTETLYPVVGDWVLLNDTVIVKVLERKNALSRGASGAHGKQNSQPRKEQVIAANLDTVCIVCGLDRDYNLRRIERYLTLTYNCSLKPAIILTKADLQEDPESFVTEVERVAFGVPVHPVSSLDCKGLSHLDPYLAFGQTTTMVGSSGAGKSTLVNRLCKKKVQTTGAISDSVGKGRHTTTSRDMIRMPQGGLVIDNPGIREIALWRDDNGIGTAFPEIALLAAECRFSNCTHRHEPGCRVLQAMIDGDIAQGRLDSYHKMRRELTYLSSRQSKSANRVEKERWKEVALKVRAIKKRGHPKGSS